MAWFLVCRPRCNLLRMVKLVSYYAPLMSQAKPALGPPTRHPIGWFRDARLRSLLNRRGRGDLPDADAVLRLEPETVARLDVEGLVELVQVAGDVGPEFRGAVWVGGEELQRELLAPLGAP